MARSSEIKVNPQLLIWARETIGEDPERVAKRLGVSGKVVEAWEKGEKAITYRKLEALADFYRRPVASFFLPEVPAELVTPTDFRTPTRGSDIKVTKELRLALRHARFVRNAYVELNPNYKRFTYRKISRSDNLDKVSWREREHLGLTFEQQRGWPVSDAFGNWVKLLEESGILVLQKSFPITELNGFSLIEGDKPPVIVINSKDVPARKTFTLFHEYCHLLLESGGICKIKTSSRELQRNDSTESFCDKFAAAFLVPHEIFFSQDDVRTLLSNPESDAALRHLSMIFKVSKQVILLKLLLNGKITKTYYDNKKKLFDAEFDRALKAKREREKKSKGGPPPYIMAISENGKMFSRAAIRAFKEGKISPKEVSGYMGVRLRHIPTIESML